MKKKNYINKDKKIKCIVNVEGKIPNSTYSVVFKIDIDVLLDETRNYISRFLDNNEKSQFADFFKKETANIILVINRYADMCTSSILPNELEQFELFKNACSKSVQYCYAKREKREQETLIMLQNEGIESYIKRAEQEGLIDDEFIQKYSINSCEFSDEKNQNFYNYLDIYSQIEAKRKCYLYYIPEIYEKVIIDKMNNNIEDYIFLAVKENLKTEILHLFYEYLEKADEEEES